MEVKAKRAQNARKEARIKVRTHVRHLNSMRVGCLLNRKGP